MDRHVSPASYIWVGAEEKPLEAPGQFEQRQEQLGNPNLLLQQQQVVLKRIQALKVQQWGLPGPEVYLAKQDADEPSHSSASKDESKPQMPRQSAASGNYLGRQFIDNGAIGSTNAEWESCDGYGVPYHAASMFGEANFGATAGEYWQAGWGYGDYGMQTLEQFQSGLGINPGEMSVQMEAAGAWDGRWQRRPQSEVPVESMKTQLQALQLEDPASVFIVRRINKLGFASPELLKNHFSYFGKVKEVYVSHSQAKSNRPGMEGRGQWRKRAAALGFVVMCEADAASTILAGGPEYLVQGASILVQTFHQHTEPLTL
mmetsp:Transcript_30858/g.55997  ORF Transcript_30858/g.55997 Transcript_30858/m.55997 type:complete len:316 (-) Transcript_30858:17-964(-)